MEPVSLQFTEEQTNFEHETKSCLDNLVERLSVFKCKLCGFISTTVEGVEIHLFDDHDESISQLKFEVENNWIKVAQREGIKLNCPMCPNLFSSERSFKVHLVEDHLLTDAEAIIKYGAENAYRREKTIRKIREEKEKLKEERRKSKRFSYEAYVNGAGELMIR